MEVSHTIFACFEFSVRQINRRAIVTDEWLRVEGCDNIYALGDCATINQRRVMVCDSVQSINCICLSVYPPTNPEILLSFSFMS